MARNKNCDWNTGVLPNHVNVDQAQLAVLMDIRDELQAIRGLAQCFRIPRALDALYEVGLDLRRKKRLQRQKAAKKRKVARER